MSVTNFPVGNALIQIKNAAMAKKRDIELVNSNYTKAVVEAMKGSGYIEEVTPNGKKLNVRLKYHKKEPVMLDLKLISKPGLRVYIGSADLETRKSPSMLLISTSKGIMSSYQAIKNKLGGEVIAEIY